MAKKKKSKKQLKLLRARMRMKRIQLIMRAIALHKKSTKQEKKSRKQVSDDVSKQLTKKVIKTRLKGLSGRISASRQRSRDLWTKRR